MEFSARVPPALLLKGGVLRHFYKTAMREFLPGKTLTKKKHGFGMSFEWVDDKLRQLTKDSLMSIRQRGFLKPAFIDRGVSANAGDRDDRAGEMARDVMVLELWMQSHRVGVRGSSFPRCKISVF